MTTVSAFAFFANSSLLRSFADFESEVEANVEKYNAGTLARLEQKTVIYGRAELERMLAALQQRDFTGTRAPSIFYSLLNRYQGLWTQNVQNAFAAAASSIEGQTKLNTPSMVQRLLNFFLMRKEVNPAEEVPPMPKRNVLYGIVRTANSNKGVRAYSQRLSVFVKMLFKTYPMNFFRDYSLLYAKMDLHLRGSDDEEVFLVSAGVSDNSCTTCRRLNGHAFTRSALEFATTYLQPNLFHPNCAHYTLRKGFTVKTYDGKAPLVTLAMLHKLVAKGELQKAKRPAKRTINV